MVAEEGTEALLGVAAVGPPAPRVAPSATCNHTENEFGLCCHSQSSVTGDKRERKRSQVVLENQLFISIFHEASAVL